MARCTKCGQDTIGNGQLCTRCLTNWTEMKGLSYTTLISLHGNMTHSNHYMFKKEMRRLENVWRKDKNKFQEEINILTLENRSYESNT